MRVLVLAEHIDLPESYLLEGLVAEGVEVELLVYSDVPCLPRVAAAGVRVSLLPLRSRFDVPAILAIRRRLREGRHDVLHCLRNNRPVANGLWATIGLDVKHVCYRGTPAHLSRWDPFSYLTYLSPRIDAITCVSDAVRRYLAEVGVPERRLVTIYKGHDPAWYRERADLAALGIPAGAFVVGAVGNWRPHKGARVLLAAAKLLRDDGAIHYALVGNLLDESIRAAVADPAIADRVHRLGFHENAHTILGACDVAVVPTTEREGLPRTMMEAMAQGVATVVTRIGGMTEVVEDGVSGLVVEPGNAADLAAAIRRLRADATLRRTIGEGARERVETRFHIRDTVRRTRELYERLLST